MADIGNVTRWFGLVEHIAPSFNLETDLVLGIIGQESSGNPYAVRPELGFWKRYATGIRAAVLGNTYAPDDRWLRYPDLGSASYGLMQVLWVVAIERGARLQYPTELCDPATNVEYGCRHLVFLREQLRRELPGAPVPTDRLLLRWNGGGDPSYPLRVADWRRRVNEAIAP